MTTARISPDSQVIGLLCSTLALPRDSGLQALTTRDWSRLAASIRTSEVGRPEALLGRKAAEIANALALPLELGRRLESLLARGGQFALELERLSNRGIWLLTRADPDYPRRLKDRLGGDAPPLFFGAGPRALPSQRGVAVIGSRNVDEAGLAFAAAVARQCVCHGLAVVSGAARGVDLAAMETALASGGAAIGVVADSLERLSQRRELREAIVGEHLTLLTPFHPAAGFNVGHAMRRNRYIYCLAEAAVVAASTLESGGTRAGALENLSANWVPLYVRADGSEGNSDLIARGGHPLRDEDVEEGATFVLTDAPEPPLSLLSDDESTPPAAPRRVHAPAGDDLFQHLWPLLEQSLATPRTAAEVATDVGLELTQARRWLARAASEEMVERRGRHRYARSGEAGPVAQRADSAAGQEAFALAWPRLEAMLRESRTAAELAQLLALEPQQARKWLSRAAKEGLVTVQGRERRYTRKASSLQQPLWNPTAEPREGR